MKLKDIVSEGRSPSDDLMSRDDAVQMGSLPHLGDIGRRSPHRGDPVMNIELPGPGGTGSGGRSIPGVSGKVKPSTSQTFKDLNPKDIKSNKSVFSKIKDLVSKPGKEEVPATKKKIEPSLDNVKTVSGSTKQVTPTTPNTATTTQTVSGKVQKPKIDRKEGETTADAIKRAQATKPLSKEAQKYKQDQEKWKEWADKNKETKTEKPADKPTDKSASTNKKIEPTLDKPSDKPVSKISTKNQKREEPSFTSDKKPSLTKKPTNKKSNYDGEEGELGRTPFEKAAMKATGALAAASLGMAGLGYKDSLKGDEEDTDTKDTPPEQEKTDSTKPADSETDNKKPDTPADEKPTSDTGSDSSDDSTPDADAAGRAVRSSTNVPSTKPVTVPKSDALDDVKRLSGILNTDNKVTTPSVKKIDYKVKPLTLPSDTDFTKPTVTKSIEPREPDYTVEPDPRTADVPALPKPSRPGEYDKTDKGLLGGTIKYRTDSEGRNWIANPQKQGGAASLYGGADDEVRYITSAQVGDAVDRAKSGVKNILGMNESVEANQALSIIKRLSRQ